MAASTLIWSIRKAEKRPVGVAFLLFLMILLLELLSIEKLSILC